MLYSSLKPNPPCRSSLLPLKVLPWTLPLTLNPVVRAGAVLPGDVNPGAAVESSPLETPDASLEIQNAQQPEDNPQEPTDSVPAPEKGTKHAARPLSYLRRSTRTYDFFVFIFLGEGWGRSVPRFREFSKAALRSVGGVSRRSFFYGPNIVECTVGCVRGTLNVRVFNWCFGPLSEHRTTKKADESSLLIYVNINARYVEDGRTRHLAFRV